MEAIDASRTVAIDGSLEGTGVAILNSCGVAGTTASGFSPLALLDLDLSRMTAAGAGGGPGGGCCPEGTTTASSMGFLIESLSFMCCTNSAMLMPIFSNVLPNA